MCGPCAAHVLSMRCPCADIGKNTNKKKYKAQHECSVQHHADLGKSHKSDMKAFAATLLQLIAATVATPVANNGYCRPSQKTYVAQYDDLPFVEPGANPLPSPYNGLTYTTFQVDQYDGFIPPTSGNQITMAFGGSGNISVPAS